MRLSNIMKVVDLPDLDDPLEAFGEHESHRHVDDAEEPAAPATSARSRRSRRLRGLAARVDQRERLDVRDERRQREPPPVCVRGERAADQEARSAPVFCRIAQGTPPVPGARQVVDEGRPRYRPGPRSCRVSVERDDVVEAVHVESRPSEQNCWPPIAWRPAAMATRCRLRPRRIACWTSSTEETAAISATVGISLSAEWMSLTVGIGSDPGRADSRFSQRSQLDQERDH